MRAAVFLSAHIIALLVIQQVHAAVFTVGPEGTHPTIQAAIDAAVALGGDNEVQIQQGTYPESLSIDTDLAAGTLLITGGWENNFGNQASDPTLTVLSGQATGRVLHIAFPTGNITIRKLTIRDGFRADRGAGIRLDCTGCSLELFDVQLIENVVDDDGEEFSGNGGSALSASIGGAGTLTLDGCLVANNTSRTRNNSRGPVDLFLRDTARATIIRSELEHNLTQAITGMANGGGLLASAEDEATLVVSLSGIDNNTLDALDGQPSGAGIEAAVRDMASFDINHSNIGHNTAHNRERQNTGTGVFLSAEGEGESRFFRNEVCSNVATGQGSTVGSGGAIWIRDDTRVTVEAGRWLDNSATSAEHLSLISQGASTLLFRDSVVADGGNLAVAARVDNAEAALHLTNLTTSGHTGILGPIVFNGVGTRTLYNSIVSDAQDELALDGVETGSNLIGVDPFFADPENDDFSLLAGSSAIDTGDGDPPGGLGEFDADGAPRVEGPTVDIGAREYSGPFEPAFLTQIGNGQADDIILKTGIEIANPGDERRAFGLDFFDPTGAPWPLELEGLGVVTSVAMALEPFQTWSARTSGTGSIEAGYARLRTGDRVDAAAVFTRTHAPTGTILYQAGVPTSQSVDDATIFVDTMGVLETGVAIVNLDGLETLADPTLTEAPRPSGLIDQVELNLYDTQFNLVDTTTLDLAAGEHVARFVTQLFPENAQVGEMQGILTARSESLIALVTLRQNDDPSLVFPNEVPTLAAFPVLERTPQIVAEPGTAADQESRREPSGPISKPFYFAQIGNGQAGTIGFQTSISVANVGGEAADLQIDFFDPEGAPLSLTLLGQGTNSNFSFNLAPGESLFLTTDGLGDITSGWARLTTPGVIDGSAVFSRFHVPSGILETESGVPSTPASDQFAIFVDTLGDSDTGIAIGSVGNVPAGGEAPPDIELDLYDAQGQLLDTRTLPLTLGKQTARFVTDLFPEVPGIGEMRGLMVARRGNVFNPTMAPVTLRQNDDPSSGFPESVGTLTAFPVLRIRNF